MQTGGPHSVLLLFDVLTKNFNNLNELAFGWLEGIEPSTSGPQPDVLPLNYNHRMRLLGFLLCANSLFFARTRDRTWDRLLKRQLLYQLSYARRIHVLEGTELPLITLEECCFPSV